MKHQSRELSCLETSQKPALKDARETCNTRTFAHFLRGPGTYACVYPLEGLSRRLHRQLNSSETLPRIFCSHHHPCSVSEEVGCLMPTIMPEALTNIQGKSFSVDPSYREPLPSTGGNMREKSIRAHGHDMPVNTSIHDR